MTTSATTIRSLLLCGIAGPCILIATQAWAGAGTACVNGSGGATTLECGDSSTTGASTLSTAVGTEAVANNTAAAAFGRRSKASGSSSTAIG